MSAMDKSKDRVNGTVKWFSGLKGFGFIAPDSGGEDLFVHQSSIRSQGFRTLSEGELVEFFVDLGQDGRTRAIDVIRLGGGSRVSGGRRGGGRGEGESGRGGYGRYGGGGNVSGGMGGRRGGRVAAGDGSYNESGGARGGECYNCGRIGHLARECYMVTGGGRGRGRNVGTGGGGRGIRERYGGGRGGGGGGGRRCYNCGGEGHFARDCPNERN